MTKTKPTITKQDPVHGVTEQHPAMGQISVSRVSSGKGHRLYDSDIGHHEWVEVMLERAQRTRTHSHDYHFGVERIASIQMSMAQWASFVSSFNTSGVPCTIEYRQVGELVEVEQIDDEPRLAMTMQETRTAATRAFDDIVNELDEVDRLIEEKAGLREVRQALHSLRSRLNNAVPNVNFATKTLAKHAEDVVQKARFDIESMVAQHAAQLGIEAPDNIIEIGPGE
jgi:hypothetical protein